jgi:hypothetical protein
MIRSTAGSASMPGGLKGVVGTILPSLLASLLAICWRAGTRAENSEWEAFLVSSGLCVVPQQPPRPALLVPGLKESLVCWIGLPRSLERRLICERAAGLLENCSLSLRALFNTWGLPSGVCSGSGSVPDLPVSQLSRISTALALASSRLDRNLDGPDNQNFLLSTLP